MSIAPLDEHTLLRLEADFCRAHQRDRFWQNTESIAAALGKTIQTFLDETNKVRAGKKFDKTTIYKALHPNADRTPINNFMNFLKGEPPSRALEEWLEDARGCLKLLLNGLEDGADSGRAEPDPAATPESESPPVATKVKSKKAKVSAEKEAEEKAEEQRQARRRANEVANRIVEFFFPSKDFPNALVKEAGQAISRRDHAWYFHPGLRQSAWPVTEADVVAEIRSMAWDAKACGTQCRIIRVSGGPRFRQVGRTDKNVDYLKPTGKQTVEAVEQGVSVVYVFPSVAKELKDLAGRGPARDAHKPAMAEIGKGPKESAELIQNFATDELRNRGLSISEISSRLRLMPLDPSTIKDNRWAGEYLSPIILWAYYERRNSGMSSRTLLAIRRTKDDSALYKMDDDAIEDFVAWLTTFAPEALTLYPSGENNRDIQRSVRHC